MIRWYENRKTNLKKVCRKMYEIKKKDIRKISQERKKKESRKKTD